LLGADRDTAFFEYFTSDGERIDGRRKTRKHNQLKDYLNE